MAGPWGDDANRKAYNHIMNHDSYSEDYIRGILTSVRTVAIVGGSNNPVRPSYFVVKYLTQKGYTVYPVNPQLAGHTLLGNACFATLQEVPRPIDMVEIFRNSEAAMAITREAIRLAPQVIWMQLTVRNDEAAALAEAAGIKVVMNRCPKIEYGKLSGEMSWAGVNSGTISNARPLLGSVGLQNQVLAKR
jgi:predicted CoA-binding protein